MRRFALLCVIAICCITALPAAPAQAASCNWTGSASSDWHNAANWSCGNVPTSSDAVTVDVIGATIDLAAPAAIASLVVKRGSISGNGSLNVAGLTSFDVFQETIFSTNGSRLPQVQITSQNAIVRITDAGLTADSLQSLSVAGGSTVLSIGDRTIPSLSLAKHPLLLNGGTLNFSGNVTVTQNLNWAAGSLGNTSSVVPANLTVAATASFSLTGGSSISGMSLVNNTTLVMNDSFFPSLNGLPRARFINNGLLEWRAPGNVQISNDGDFINNGTMRKFNGGEIYFGLGLPFHNTGLVEVHAGRMRFYDSYNQNTGELRLAGGSIEGNNQYSQLKLHGGLLSGTGVITSSVQNIGGTLAPTGLLKILGSYTQNPTATLDLAIRGSVAGSDFGVVQIVPNQGSGGGATISTGQLRINTANGFRAAAGDRFQIFTCSTGCQGTFATASGNLAPAFGGFAANNEIVVSEPQSALLVSIQPDAAKMRKGESNRYTLNVVNPTTQALTVTNLTITLPISFTYQTGSMLGAISTNPNDFANSAAGIRQLYWSQAISIPAGGSSQMSFGINAIQAITIGEYPLNLQLLVGGNQVSYTRLAPITIPLEAIEDVGIPAGSAGKLVTTTNPPSLLVPSASISQGLTIRARITCPFPSCGNLTAVYIEHGGRLISMQQVPAPQMAGIPPIRQADDYGFWDGYISGPNVFPGEPTRIFPDWDDHRPCIYYDYGGGGGRPQGCVPGGDPGPTPQLYDPSGIVSDAATGLPIEGATVTLYRIQGAVPDTRSQTRDCRTIDTRGGNVWSGIAPNTGVVENPNLQPKQIDPQMNPQVTGSNGRYGWNVVTGCWYVQVSAPGYQSKISALVGVPPEVTDLDIALVKNDTPQAGQQYVYLPVVVR